MKTKARKLAEAITKDLMTYDGSRPVVVERIALMKKQPHGTELNMGGRCTESVIQVIERHLVEICG